MNDEINIKFDPSQTLGEISPPSIEKKKEPSLMEHLPFPEADEQAHKPIKAVALRDDLLTELNEHVFSPEETLEQLLASLKEEGDLIGYELKFEELITGYSNLATSSIKGGISTLRALLPQNIEELPAVQDAMSVSNNIAKLGVIFTLATDGAAHLLAIVCKERMIRESKMLLERMKEEAKLFAGSEKGEKIEKTLKEWEIKLHLEIDQLHEEKVGLGFATARCSLVVTKDIINIIKEKLKALAPAVEWLGVAVEALALALHIREFKHVLHCSNSFTEWQSGYLNWQKEHTPTVDKRDVDVDVIQESSNLEGATAHLTQIRFQEQIIKTADSVDVLDQIIQAAPDLLIKRQAVARKKVLLLLPQFEALKPKIQETNRSIFEKSDNREGGFQVWFDSQPREVMLAAYVDHQETLEITTKNALREVILQKHQLEEKFVKFNLVHSGTTMGLSAVCLGLSAGLAILGLCTIEFGGAGALLLALSIVPLAVALGFYIAQKLLSFSVKSKMTKALFTGLNTKILMNQLARGVSNWWHNHKHEHLKEVAKILHSLHISTPEEKRGDPNYQKALLNYEKAKVEFEQSKVSLESWSAKLKELEKIQLENGWQDFVKHAALIREESPEAFDSLRAFHLALKECNLELLNDETKYLLETQLGMDLDKLQRQISQDPEAIQTALQQFAAKNEGELIAFFGKQKMRIATQVIPAF